MNHNKGMPVNQFPLWKNILIVVVLAVCFFYALPNIFGKSPALQISLKEIGRAHV